MHASVVRYTFVRETSPEGTHPHAVFDALTHAIVGQREALEMLVLALIADGHVLFEGPPGIAKTRACRALAGAVQGKFSRIQFMPDLLPSDIVGTRIFDQRTCQFTTQLGPIFGNIVLADEINRAPAGAQAALLEAMQERCVTIARKTHSLPDPFLVLATMNSHDPEGTFPLSLAQRDRFLTSVALTYPTREQECEILRRFSSGETEANQAIVPIEEIRAWRQDAQKLELLHDVREHIVAIVRSTRPEEGLPPDLRGYVTFGAGPRAALAISRLARARAFFKGQPSVERSDVRAVAFAALRHRIAYSYQVSSDKVDPDELTRRFITS